MIVMIQTTRPLPQNGDFADAEPAKVCQINEALGRVSRIQFAARLRRRASGWWDSLANVPFDFPNALAGNTLEGLRLFAEV